MKYIINYNKAEAKSSQLALLKKFHEGTKRNPSYYNKLSALNRKVMDNWRTFIGQESAKDVQTLPIEFSKAEITMITNNKLFGKSATLTEVKQAKGQN